MKRLYQSFCGLIFVLIVTVNAQDSSLLNIPEKDFATPEAAVKHFVEGIAKNDVMAALEAFAINQYSEQFDLVFTSQRLQALNPSEYLAPPDYPMYRELNRLQLASNYASQIKIFTYSFFVSELLDTISIEVEREQILKFIASVNPEQLANLKITSIFRVVALTDRTVNMWEQQAKPTGADEVTELIILYELDSNYYLGGARLLRYDEGWKLDGLFSIVASMPPVGMSLTGAVIKTTQEGFESVLTNVSDGKTYKLEQVQ